MGKLYIPTLIKELLQCRESEWLEFKKDNNNPEEIGKNISAISNSLALLERNQGYILWGVDSSSEKFVGTNFQPRKIKRGNEELENWLVGLLEPKVNFTIYEDIVDGKRGVIFEIKPAVSRPTRFSGTEYIRIGSQTRKLQDFPEKERTLWKALDTKPFENNMALENLTGDKVLTLIDYPNYFKKFKERIPENHAAILDRLKSEKIIISKNGSQLYHITNKGAILFCNNLEDFHSFIKKTPRVISYQGTNRIKGIREKQFNRGYAIDFENIVDYTNSQIPRNEEIKKALREEVSMYPTFAVRELIANALIHQDFNSRGSGPMIEIFSDRMEISNPGKPLIDTLRFIDEPPRSRNESIVNLMRRMNICEDRGSGIDKVILEIEFHQLPAPAFRATDHSTVVTLFSTKEFSEMNIEERIRACYQHACLQWVSGQSLTNTSLRKRFGISDKNYPMASKVIKDCIDKKLIKITSARGLKYSYAPFWT